MKKLFLVLGAIAMLLIILAAIFVFGGNRLDASSKAFVDTNMPSFYSTLSKDELLKVSTAEVRQNMNNDETDHLFSKLKQLGAFQKYEGSKGEATIAFNYKNCTVTMTADYLASASFQNGPVQVEVKLVRNKGEWLINDFAIFSPIFTK